jgi:adenine-specific DNA-methyltransferase
MPTLQFKGKSIVQTYHLTLPYHQLLPDAAASHTDKLSLHDNLIIHGDNLLALKSLLPSFAGQVKCIYIDPPYNTGEEKWSYNDNVNSPMHQEWLRKVVDREDLTRHDKWLCMMLPRLRLLRELLREDGVIFISIDDNEVHHLRMLMDEVFGEENWVATFVWQAKDTPGNDSSEVATTHNYILCYKRSSAFEMGLLARTEKQLANYKNPDNDPRGPWLGLPLTRGEYRERDYYPLVNPAGEEVWPPAGNSWRRPKATIERYQQEGRLWWGKDGKSKFPFTKKFLNEMKAGVVPVTWWDYKFAGSTRRARAEIKDLFEGERGLETIKPVQLVRRLLELVSEPDADDIILDSFAGSGTTGHAVLALNAEDGGNRRFIMVEQEDYAESLTAERIRRVINGVPSARDEALQQGYGGSFSFFRLGEALNEEALLTGERLPSYREMARYVFFTATGEQLDESQVDEERYYLGTSKQYEVYMIYQPSIEFLKTTPLTLSWAESLGQPRDKTRLVIASHKYLDEDRLREHKLEYCQLPFALYRFRG